MIHTSNGLILGPSLSVVKALAGGVARCLAFIIEAVTALEEALERNRQRRALSKLEDHHLRDIGITRTEATREADKPFWRR